MIKDGNTQLNFFFISIQQSFYLNFYSLLHFQLKVTDHGLPQEMPEAPYSDDFLKSFHHSIMEVTRTQIVFPAFI